MLEFNDTQFDNIAWQIKDKTISILMDPNQFKLLEIPIKVMGEINGMIYMKTGSKLRSQGRVQINIFDANGNFIAKTQSESDGYYNYLGLGPGKYYAEIDSMQLSRLKAIAEPDRTEFEIQPSENGDIIDNIEFTLIKQLSETQVIEPVEPQKETLQQTQVIENSEKVKTKTLPVLSVQDTKKTEVRISENQPITSDKKVITELPKESEKPEAVISNIAVQEKPEESANETTGPGRYYIQAGAFKDKITADQYAKVLLSYTLKRWFVIYETEFYKVRLGYFPTRKAAMEIEKGLNMPNKQYYIDKIQ
jgi:hypothetical protein